MSCSRLAEDKIGFKTVKLLSNVPLGTGSYGSVYKAQCDDLVCAAKVLHPTLVAAIVHERSPQKKFLDEIEFLGHLRHPNIVQFLGVKTDTSSNLPILLMELMDESLTQFLTRFEDPLPLYTQLNICFNVAMALSYLHNNGIVHRDLSSNNVLMLGSRCIKVSDFGMAKLRNQRISNTMCPGAEVYMPPEAVLDNPTYSEKIDCFSYGVLTIQVITRRFPSPGPRTKQVTINGRVLLEPQSEYTRREEDMLTIPNDHVLRNLAINCLQENERDRPSANQLSSFTAQQRERCGKQHSPEELEKNLMEREKELIELRDMLQHKDEKIGSLTEQVQALSQQLEARVEHPRQPSEEKTAICRPVDSMSLSESLKQLQLTSQSGLKEGPPVPVVRSCDAVVSGCFLYIMHQECHMFVYNNLAESWSQLPDCPIYYCSLAILEDSLVTVGGLQQDDGEKTNKLYTLRTSSGRYLWSLDYPPMPTKRRSVIVATSGSCLVVMGGVLKEGFSKRVEVLCTNSRTWSVASSLPVSLHKGSAAVSDNKIFVLGGWISHSSQSYAAMSCTLEDLINSCSDSGMAEESCADKSDDVWVRLPRLPVTQATCVFYQNYFLAIGGEDEAWMPSRAILAYDSATSSWIKTSELSEARSECIAAVLSNGELMVVGGYTGRKLTNATDTFETIH